MATKSRNTPKLVHHENVNLYGTYVALVGITRVREKGRMMVFQPRYSDCCSYHWATGSRVGDWSPLQHTSVGLAAVHSAALRLSAPGCLMPHLCAFVTCCMCTQFRCSCILHYLVGKSRAHWLLYLFILYRYGHLDVVKYLLQLECSIDVKDEDDWTPLHWAAKYVTKILAYIAWAWALITQKLDSCAYVLDKVFQFHFHSLSIGPVLLVKRVTRKSNASFRCMPIHEVIECIP